MQLESYPHSYPHRMRPSPHFVRPALRLMRPACYFFILFVRETWQSNVLLLEAILGQKFVAIPTIPDNPDNSQLQRQHLSPLSHQHPITNTLCKSNTNLQKTCDTVQQCRGPPNPITNNVTHCDFGSNNLHFLSI